MYDKVNSELIAIEYANEAGAVQVWKAWVNTMLEQGRDVDDKFINWPIPERDIKLDADIAYAVVDDFLMWAKVHHGIELVRTVPSCA